MKIYLLSISFFLTLFASCQTETKPLLISTNGVDSIKIGMSKPDVEKVINAKLKPYITPDSIPKKQDTATMNNTCKDCSEYLICTYKGIELLLTFFRYTMYKKSDFELVGITSTSTLPVLETNTGIKAGMSVNEFIEICKKNKYPYKFMGFNDKNKRCFFSDNLNKQSSKVLIIKISGTVITSLDVFNMIGD